MKGDFSGGIAGFNEGTLFDVHAKGTVKAPPGVGRGVGGIAGYSTGTIDLVSAQVDTYVNQSAGGLVGRLRGGSLSRGWANGVTRSEESPGAAFGIVEFTAEIRDVYALGRVEGGVGDRAIGNGGCVRCFFSGTFGGLQVNQISGQYEPISDAQLTDPAATLSSFDNSWVLASGKRPRLAWELAPPGAPPLEPLLPFDLEIYNPHYAPRTMMVRGEVAPDAGIYHSSIGAFGGRAGGNAVYAVA